MNWGADGDDGGMNRAGDGGCGVAGGPLGGELVKNRVFPEL